MTSDSTCREDAALSRGSASRRSLGLLTLLAFAANALAAGPAVDGLRTGQGQLRTAAEQLVMQHEPEVLLDNMMSGGPPPDGIPSIDNPRFIAASEADLDPGDKVIGLARNGVVRAYPQHILVYHEIVNDEIAGENVAVTYCPLTATVLAFRTGTTALGVSGRLINSNLVMYDRDTRSVWPQIPATAIAGERNGDTLDEVDVVWTTWGQWRGLHPETEVLSDRTGAVRNYARDPYGSYNPASGYYARSQVMFPVLHEDDELPAKRMVSGARTAERAVFFDLEELARDGLQETAHFVGVFDERLGIARIYESDGKSEFELRDGQVVKSGTGERFAPDALPLEAVTAIEAFYFAWNAFYPDSEHP